MIRNTESQDQQTKIIENLARNLASKRPKETNFNNTKTRKYFGNKTLKDSDQNSNTLVDSLLANQVCSSISTNNKTDSMTSLMNKKANDSHKRIPSNFFRVDKNLGKFTEIVSSQKTFIKIPAKFVDEETTLDDSLEDLNENTKYEGMKKQNKTFEKYNSIKANPKDTYKSENLLSARGEAENDFLNINSNFLLNEKSIEHEKNKHNLTDIHLNYNNSNINNKHASQKGQKNKINNFEFEKEKLDFFELFNYENLFNMHKYYAKLISNFEINNNFFQREKILKKLFDIINTKPYYFPHKMTKFFEDKALVKNFKIYFFIEITILALLFHADLDEHSDLHCAFKHCLFYLNQNLLILTHFVLEKLEQIEKFTKKDASFENFYLSHLNLQERIEAGINRSSAAYNIEAQKSLLDSDASEQGSFKNLFRKSLLEKEYVKRCQAKVEENKTWLDKHYIFKNLNNNNKNMVNVCKNIIDIFISMPVERNELLIVYYEIKDLLNDFSKIRIEKNLEDFDNKLIRILCELNELNKDFILAKEQKNNLVKTTTSIDDFAEFTIRNNLNNNRITNNNNWNNQQNTNPFEIQNQNFDQLSNDNNLLRTKDENISDSEENKKHFFNESVNRKNTTNISDFANLNNSNNEAENCDASAFQSHHPSFNPETAEKSRDSLTLEIHSNRESTGSKKSRDSCLAKHRISKSPDPNKLRINSDPPYLPSKSLMRNPRAYTLVLDLDETLVHFVEENDSAYIQIRPGAEHFLEEMSKFYEIVVFTAAMQDYADLVLNELDKTKSVSFRLYRQHTIMQNNFYIKDLAKLGRDIDKMLIIDNVAENYKLQKENGINIKNFEGDEEDTELIDLIPDLKDLVVNKTEDVRKKLPEIIEKMNNRDKAKLQTRRDS